MAIIEDQLASREDEEEILLPVNRAGGVAWRLGSIAIVTLGVLPAFLIFGGDRYRAASVFAVLCPIASFVLGVLGIVFGSIGLRGTPKGGAITGFVTGIVAVLGMPMVVVIGYTAMLSTSLNTRFESVDSSLSDSHSSYLSCWNDPYTTLAECKAEFPGG